MVSMRKMVLFTKIIIIAWAGVCFGQKTHSIPSNLDLRDAKPLFNSSGYQSSIKTNRSLAELAMSTSFLDTSSLALGFSAKSAEAQFFIIGALYSQIVALLNGDSLELAARHLDKVESELIDLGAPGGLFNYTSNLRNMIITKRNSKEVTYEFASLLQPFLEDFAKARIDNKAVLLDAGSWLVDFGLAASAGDVEKLRQGNKISYFLKEMERLEAPKGVIESYQELLAISGKKEISESDFSDILRLVRKIQTILS
jgi:hypothetical protein